MVNCTPAVIAGLLVTAAAAVNAQDFGAPDPGMQEKKAKEEEKKKYADSFWDIRGKLFPQFQMVSTSGATPAGTSTATFGRKPDGKTIPSYNEVNGNSSRLRIYGWRNLGNKELRAIWQIETEVPVDTGDGTWASRDTFVGLDGKWGKIKLGRIETPFKDLHGIKFLDGTDASDVVSKLPFAGSGSTASFSLRPNNVVQYETPKLGQFNFRAMYSPDETRTENKNAPLVSYGASWGDDEGPYYIALAHEIHKDFFGGSTSVGSGFVNGAGTGSSFVAGTGVHSRDTGIRLTGSYLIGKTRIGAGISRFKWSESGGAIGKFQSYAKTSYEVNVMSDFGPVTGYLMYGWANAGTCTLVGGAACSTEGLQGRIIHAAIEYPMWEGLSVTAVLQKLINGPAASYDVVANGRPSPGVDQLMYGLRLTYRF